MRTAAWPRSGSGVLNRRPGAAALTVWWLVIPAAAFAWLMQRHDQVLRARDEASRASRSTNAASPGSRTAGGHRRAGRSFPRRSPRLCERSRSVRPRFAVRAAVARTDPLGEETLARWLTSPADAPRYEARQDAVQELSGRARSPRAAGGHRRHVRGQRDTDRLLAWAESPMPPGAPLERSPGLHRRRGDRHSVMSRPPAAGGRSAPS